MKSHPAPCLFLLLLSACAAADEAGLKEARQRMLRGNYGEALERYENLAKDAKERVEATLGISRCLESQGEYDRALEVIESLQKDRTKDVKLLARQAELLYLRGRWDAAQKA